MRTWVKGWSKGFVDVWQAMATELDSLHISSEGWGTLCGVVSIALTIVGVILAIILTLMETIG